MHGLQRLPERTSIPALDYANVLAAFWAAYSRMSLAALSARV
jgi:hypothetical protein